MAVVAGIMGMEPRLVGCRWQEVGMIVIVGIRGVGLRVVGVEIVEIVEIEVDGIVSVDLLFLLRLLLRIVMAEEIDRGLRREDDNECVDDVFV